jgi:hypothetical protein
LKAIAVYWLGLPAVCPVMVDSGLKENPPKKKFRRKIQEIENRKTKLRPGVL